MMPEENPIKPLRLATFALYQDVYRQDADRMRIQVLLDALNAEAKKFGLVVRSADEEKA